MKPDRGHQRSQKPEPSHHQIAIAPGRQHQDRITSSKSSAPRTCHACQELLGTGTRAPWPTAKTPFRYTASRRTIAFSKSQSKRRLVLRTGRALGGKSNQGTHPTQKQQWHLLLDTARQSSARDSLWRNGRYSRWRETSAAAANSPTSSRTNGSVITCGFAINPRANSTMTHRKRVARSSRAYRR